VKNERNFKNFKNPEIQESVVEIFKFHKSVFIEKSSSVNLDRKFYMNTIINKNIYKVLTKSNRLKATSQKQIVTIS